MGIYDREYYREEERQGLFLGGSWSAVGTIVFLNVAIWLLDAVASNLGLNEKLGVYANLFERIAAGEYWRVVNVVTAGFVHTPSPDFLHIGLNMFTLWMFGRDIEGIYGKRLFWRLYLSLVIVSSLGWVLTENFFFGRPGSFAFGASGAVAGIFLLYILHFPKRTLLFMGAVPAPAWLIGVIWLGQELTLYQRELLTGQNEMRIGYAAHLTGALFGAVFFRWHWTLFSLLPTHWLSSLRRMRQRRALKVVRDEEPEEDLDEQVDRILAKISRYGTDSLTDEEQRTLEAASRRAQRRRGVRERD
jgi:membrane associated rhomboid family serine protease